MRAKQTVPVLDGFKDFFMTALDRVAVIIAGKDDIACFEPPFGILSNGTGDIVRRNFKKGTVVVRDHLSRTQFELPAHKIHRPQFS